MERKATVAAPVPGSRTQGCCNTHAAQMRGRWRQGDEQRSGRCAGIPSLLPPSVCGWGPHQAGVGHQIAAVVEVVAHLRVIVILPALRGEIPARMPRRSPVQLACAACHGLWAREGCAGGLPRTSPGSRH